MVTLIQSRKPHFYIAKSSQLELCRRVSIAQPQQFFFMGLISFNLLNTLVVFSLALVLEVLLLSLNILLHVKVRLTLPLRNI